MFRAPLVRRLPEFRWTLLTAVAMVLTALATRPISDPSPWLHLKVGEFLLHGHRFGSPDPFGPYAVTTYQPTQWLPSVLSAVLYDHLGAASVSWVRAACISCFLFTLVLAARQAARPSVALGAALLALAGSWPSLTERPQLLGFVMVVVTVAAWWRTAHDGRARWWLVPFTWLAACVHGVWAMGLGLGFVTVVGLVLQGLFAPRQRNRLIMLLAACLAAAAVTPLGPRLVLSPFMVGGNARQFVSEWMASSARTPSVAITLLALACVVAMWVHRERRPPVWQLLLWVTAVLLVLVMQRTVAIGAIVAALLLAETTETCVLSPAAGPNPPHRSQRPWRYEPWVLAAATVLAMILAVPLAAVRGSHPQGVPTALLSELRALPPSTHVISDGDLSGWLMFQAPQLLPVFDIRVEIYSPAHIRGFIDALAAKPGWAAYLSRTQARAAILKANAPLASAVADQWHWHRAGATAGYVLLEAP
jgi:hypothetical protein